MKKATSLMVSALMTGALSATGPATQAAQITWDGGGDGQSTFQEENWVVTDDTGSATLNGLVGSNPPADFINGATPVQADVVVGGSGAAGGAIGAGNHFDLGDGFSLTISDNASFRMQLESFGNGPRGIRGVIDGATESLIIQDSAAVFSQFLLNLTASMTDAATLTLGGGGVNSLNNTTLDLAADWTGSVTWTNFNVTGTSIFDKITVGGAPAIEGLNVLVVSNGSSGSVLTVIPEPASLVLLGLGGLTIMAGRRRRTGASGPTARHKY